MTNRARGIGGWRVVADRRKEKRVERSKFIWNPRNQTKRRGRMIDFQDIRSTALEGGSQDEVDSPCEIIIKNNNNNNKDYLENRYWKGYEINLRLAFVQIVSTFRVVGITDKASPRMLCFAFWFDKGEHRGNHERDTNRGHAWHDLPQDILVSTKHWTTPDSSWPSWFSGVSFVWWSTIVVKLKVTKPTGLLAWIGHWFSSFFLHRFNFQSIHDERREREERIKWRKAGIDPAAAAPSQLSLLFSSLSLLSTSIFFLCTWKYSRSSPPMFLFYNFLFIQSSLGFSVVRQRTFASKAVLLNEHTGRSFQIFVFWWAGPRKKNRL